jgi:uncharacterized protein
MQLPAQATSRHRALWILIADRLPRGDLAHDALHVLRVFRWALRLSEEAGADPDLAGAAALLHDLVHIPKDHPDRPLGGERSAQAAGGVLSEAGYSADEVGRVVEAIRTSSWSRGRAPTCPEGVVLQDADRLDALGAIGVARTFATAQAIGTDESSLYHPADPLALTARPLDDRRRAVDHFAAKLLRLADGMHLPTARAEARRRHATMEAFLAALGAELVVDAVPRIG